MYEINLEILRAYLETLEQNGVAGYTGSAFQCPVARAAKHHYGTQFIVTQEHYYPKGHREAYATTPDDIVEVITAVDRATPTLHHQITRAEVEHVLEGLGL